MPWILLDGHTIEINDKNYIVPSLWFQK